jgi:ADP-ribose pyrophosphatase
MDEQYVTWRKESSLRNLCVSAVFTSFVMHAFAMTYNQAMSHELIKRDFIYRGRILDLSISRFQTASKGEVDLEIVHHNGGAAILPLFDDGTIALVRQWRYPALRYSIEVAAGRIEPGQTPEQTAAREMEEEIGYRAREFQRLTEFLVAPGYCEERIYVYIARGLEKSAQNLDDDEEIEVIRMTIEEALARVRSGEIDDAKTMITLLLAAGMK